MHLWWGGGGRERGGEEGEGERERGGRRRREEVGGGGRVEREKVRGGGERGGGGGEEGGGCSSYLHFVEQYNLVRSRACPIKCVQSMFPPPPFVYSPQPSHFCICMFILLIVCLFVVSSAG